MPNNVDQMAYYKMSTGDIVFGSHFLGGARSGLYKDFQFNVDGSVDFTVAATGQRIKATLAKTADGMAGTASPA